MWPHPGPSSSISSVCPLGGPTVLSPARSNYSQSLRRPSMGWPCIMVVNMAWEVNVQLAPGPRPVSKRWLVGLVGRLLGLKEIPAAEVGLVITGEEEIRQLNRQFRGVDEPTDVLAFPLEGDPTFPSPDGRRHLGE